MSLYDDFQSEIIAQTDIIFYLQKQFEKEYRATAHILGLSHIESNIDILYNDNTKMMSELLSKCDEKIAANSKLYIEVDDLPEWVRRIDLREPMGEIIEYCIEALRNEEALTLEVLKKALNYTNQGVKESIYGFSDEKLQELIDVSCLLFKHEKNSILAKQDYELENLKNSIRLVDNSSSSNIFRQAFINIFSLFDAFVFDCLKTYFYNHPTELDNYFENKNNEKVKVLLCEVIEYTAIDDLKNEMIERQFSGKYLSEAVAKLKRYKPETFENIDYAKFMEMIERRNIHIHNKGIVDSKYSSSYNIYNLSVGEYAYIDSNYLLVNVFNTLSILSENLKNILQ